MSRHAAPEPSEKREPKKAVTLSVVLTIWLMVMGASYGIYYLTDGSTDPNVSFARVLLSAAIGFAAMRLCIRVWDGRHGN